MTKEEIKTLKEIAAIEPWLVRQKLQFFIESAVVEEIPGTRTSPQNRALHLFFKLLANAFNDAGYSVQVVVKQKIDVDWNERLIKDLIWRPAQIAILNIESTKDLAKQNQIDKVYEHLNRHIGEKFGIHVPFPVDETKQAGYKTKTGAFDYPDNYEEPLI